MNERGNSPKRFTTHDFLRIGDDEAFVSSIAPESWVQEILLKTQTVVVRRGPRPGVLVPVEVRGTTSSQRCAGFISPNAVIERISPEQLVEWRTWKSHPQEEIKALRHLEAITCAWAPLGVSWGPVGGIGYELFTGLPISEMERDLELIVRAEERVSIDLAGELIRLSDSPEIRVDLHLETPLGGLALAEYLKQTSKVLLQTDTGPKFVHDPWNVDIS
jgi:phosphoribosyl-dephospho-CoA transferase